MPDFIFRFVNLVDDTLRTELAEMAKVSKSISAPVTIEPLPQKVDLSEHLHYIRKQWGGCWGYATLAVWDIMNEITCPYSPNLSFRLWRTFHGRPDLRKKKEIYSPDGRFHVVDHGRLEGGERPFFQSFGCTTEGTEPTLHGYPPLWPEGGWTREGINEAYNYRLECEPRKLKKINSDEFMRWLRTSHPIRAESSIHVVAVVGYDRAAQTFKYVNSAGDKWGKDEYGEFTFQQLDNGQYIGGIGGPIINAYILEKWRHIAPPRPVPAALISFKHNDDRGNVHLWLGVEDSPHPANKIWPHGWDDESRKLCLTVRLPSEFIWPPSGNNRLVLDLHDTATLSKTGGTIEEFTAAFGGHIVESSELSKGPVSFKAHEHRTFCIP